MANQSIMVTRTCHCDSTEIFSYRDWLDRGFQVQRGERGIRVTELRMGRNREYEANVVKFCLCQVEDKN